MLQLTVRLVPPDRGAQTSKGKGKQVPKDNKEEDTRKGSDPKTPQMRTLVLQIGQALPCHVTHTVTAMTTMNRLLMCFKNF